MVLDMLKRTVEVEMTAELLKSTSFTRTVNNARRADGASQATRDLAASIMATWKAKFSPKKFEVAIQAIPKFDDTFRVQVCKMLGKALFTRHRTLRVARMDGTRAYCAADVMRFHACSRKLETGVRGRGGSNVSTSVSLLHLPLPLSLSISRSLSVSVMVLPHGTSAPIYADMHNPDDMTACAHT